MHRASVIVVEGFFVSIFNFILRWYGEFLKLFLWYVHEKVGETLIYCILPVVIILLHSKHIADDEMRIVFSKCLDEVITLD